MRNDELYHYRRKGDLNGRTRFPGKYTPIGELAKAARPDYDDLTLPKPSSNFTNKGPNAAYPSRSNDFDSRNSNFVNNGPASAYSSRSNSVDSKKSNFTKNATKSAYSDEYNERRMAANSDVANINTAPLRAAKLRQQQVRSTAGTGAMNVYANAAKVNNAARRIGVSNQIQRGINNIRNNSIVANAKNENAKLLYNYKRDKNAADAERRRIAGGTAGIGSHVPSSAMADRSSYSRADRNRVGSKYTSLSARPEGRHQSAESEARNKRSAVGNAIADARKNKDFGKFMKDDIKDRVKRGKSKVRNLLKKWF